MSEEIFVKIHESYRKVIVICDSDLIGKKVKEGIIQLDVKENFYSGDKMSEQEIASLIKNMERDFPSYNIVGKKAISLCIKEKLISEQGVKTISGIPHAMVF
ncbi:MAG: DUF424 family protein [Nanoarchaeota archaeon]|nr:DUF424 family protein [Nanoarchaeota archaeon]